jgi:hypothetical protein
MESVRSHKSVQEDSISSTTTKWEVMNSKRYKNWIRGETDWELGWSMTNLGIKHLPCTRQVTINTGNGCVVCGQRVPTYWVGKLNAARRVRLALKGL